MFLGSMIMYSPRSVDSRGVFLIIFNLRYSVKAQKMICKKITWSKNIMITLPGQADVNIQGVFSSYF